MTGEAATATSTSAPATVRTVLDPTDLTIGWFGTRPMVHQDDAYTLLSGPDAPSGAHGPE